MPSCTPPGLLIQPCRNFSDYVGIFPTMSHFKGGIFPTMSKFLPIPILYAGKNPLFVHGRAPRSIWCKKTMWVAVKIFLSLLRESSVICKAISRKSAETFSSFFTDLSSQNQKNQNGETLPEVLLGKNPTSLAWNCHQEPNFITYTFHIFDNCHSRQRIQSQLKLSCRRPNTFLTH